MEEDDRSLGHLRVLSYSQITVANAVGVKRTLRSKAFKGYLRAEERNVRAAEQNEILTILQGSATDPPACRDRLPDRRNTWNQLRKGHRLPEPDDPCVVPRG